MVLLQIKTFWAQLSWPDVESSYAFISKILDVSHHISISRYCEKIKRNASIVYLHLLTAQLQDVCKITIFYSDKMVARVTRERNNNAVKFQVSETLCLAINNIDYVLQYIQPFVQVNRERG